MRQEGQNIYHFPVTTLRDPKKGGGGGEGVLEKNSRVVSCVRTLWAAYVAESEG